MPPHTVNTVPSSSKPTLAFGKPPVVRISATAGKTNPSPTSTPIIPALMMIDFFMFVFELLVFESAAREEIRCGPESDTSRQYYLRLQSTQIVGFPFADRDRDGSVPQPHFGDGR